MATPARPAHDRSTPVRTFRDLNVWNKALELAVEVHRVTTELKPEMPVHLANGMREASTGVVTHLAQGHTHSYLKDFLRCLDASLSDVTELEMRVLLAKVLGHLSVLTARDLEARIGEVRRMEWGLVNSLRARDGRP